MKYRIANALIYFLICLFFSWVFDSVDFIEDNKITMTSLVLMVANIIAVLASVVIAFAELIIDDFDIIKSEESK